jgi:hypothetical protein
VFTGAETLVDLGSVTGAINVDLSTGSAFILTLTGNVTVTFTNPQAGKVTYATLRCVQDATGGHTLTITGAQGSNGVRPVLTLAGNAVDKVACESWDGGAHWDATLTGQAIA